MQRYHLRTDLFFGMATDNNGAWVRYEDAAARIAELEESLISKGDQNHAVLQKVYDLEEQLVTAQERERWHFDDPPSRGRWYWCACERFGGVQMSVYYTPEGTWNRPDVVAWRFLPAPPEPQEEIKCD